MNGDHWSNRIRNTLKGCLRTDRDFGSFYRRSIFPVAMMVCMGLMVTVFFVTVFAMELENVGDSPVLSVINTLAAGFIAATVVALSINIYRQYCKEIKQSEKH